MPTKLGIVFSGMMVGGAAFLISGVAAYLTMAQLQYSSMARLQDRTMQAAKLQDRIIQAKGPAQLTLQFAQFPPQQ